MQLTDSGPRTRVLLVEDDEVLRMGLSTALQAEGFIVNPLSDAPDQSQIDHVFTAFEPEIALLDVGLPGAVDGFDLAAQLRERADVPVIFVTAADSLDDRLRGFELGCDDYLVKPFSIHELMYRMRAVLRRVGTVTDELRVDDVLIETGRRIASRKGKELPLTPTQFDLLVELARNPGTPKTKLELVRAVWGYDESAPHLVEVQIGELRKKLELHGPRVILTTRNGYCLRAG